MQRKIVLTQRREARATRFAAARPVVQSHDGPGRSGGVVGGGQRVRKRILDEHELAQLIGETPNPRNDAASRMMRDEVADRLGPALVPQVASAVARMKMGVPQGACISDVVLSSASRRPASARAAATISSGIDHPQRIDRGPRSHLGRISAAPKDHRG